MKISEVKTYQVSFMIYDLFISKKKLFMYIYALEANVYLTL